MSGSLKPVLDPGALSVRMGVEEPVADDDAMGGGTIHYVHRRSLWARFDADSPSQAFASPVRDALARGRVTMRVGLAPPVGWRLCWHQRDTHRCLEVISVAPGTQAFPFDVCDVREVAP